MTSTTLKDQPPVSEIGESGKEAERPTNTDDHINPLVKSSELSDDSTVARWNVRKSFWDMRRRFHRQSTELMPFTLNYQHFTEQEMAEKFIYEPWRQKSIEWDRDNDGSKEDNEAVNIFGFTGSYDWIEDLDPITREEIDTDMADWPQWPYERYSYRELAEIMASRGYGCYQDPRLKKIIAQKYKNWRVKHRIFEKAFEKTMHNRYAPDSELKGKIERIVEASWQCPPQPYANKVDQIKRWEACWKPKKNEAREYRRKKERAARRQQRREDESISRNI